MRGVTFFESPLTYLIDVILEIFKYRELILVKADYIGTQVVCKVHIKFVQIIVCKLSLEWEVQQIWQDKGVFGKRSTTLSKYFLI